MIKLRSQRNRNGCGLACVAMISNVSYKKVKRDFVKMFGEPDWVVGPKISTQNGFRKDFATTAKQLSELLAKNKVKSAGRLSQFKTWEKLPDICVLAVNVRDNGRKWHWVVYDGKSKTVYDPYPYHTDARWSENPGQIRTDYKRMRPKAYLKVSPK